MKINIKNNSTFNSEKFESIKEFLKFSQETSPLKKEISFMIVNETNQELFNGDYMIGVSGKSFKEVLYDVSKKWISEFSKQRRINCGEKEVALMVDYFFKKFPFLNFN
jgi:hypothetical protein